MEVVCIEIQVDQARKCVDIWLTRSEAGNSELQERLHSLYAEYNSNKYTVAVFLSGEDDLSTLTSQLLVHNRLRLAERENA